MLGGQFGAFWGWSVCSGENKNTPFFGVVNLDRYRLVNLSVFSILVTGLARCARRYWPLVTGFWPGSAKPVTSNQQPVATRDTR